MSVSKVTFCTAPPRGKAINVEMRHMKIRESLAKLYNKHQANEGKASKKHVPWKELFEGCPVTVSKWPNEGEFIVMLRDFLLVKFLINRYCIQLFSSL